jgi:hypothetical protein
MQKVARETAKQDRHRAKEVKRLARKQAKAVAQRGVAQHG